MCTKYCYHFTNILSAHLFTCISVAFKFQEATGTNSQLYKWFSTKTGCGVHKVLGKRVVYSGNFYLANTTAVFQAEVTALKKLAEMFVGAGWTHQRTHQMTKQCPFILTELFIIYT